MEMKHKVRISKFFEDLIPEFIKGIKEDMENMRQAIDRKDFETLYRLGHSFKGASGNYELEDLAGIFLEIENAAAKHDFNMAEICLNKAYKYVKLVKIEFVE